MSKIKLLINEVFKRAELDSGIKKKYPLALYLKVHLEAFKIYFDEKTFVRYYEGETEPDPETLNKLSKYLGYKDFSEFSKTFVKMDEDAKSTTVKVSIDDGEEKLSKKISDIFINITNTLENTNTFNLPEFVKQNGLGIVGIMLVISTLVGNQMFSKNKEGDTITNTFGFFSDKLDIDKKYMYWNAGRYFATDSSKLGPLINVVPMNPDLFKYFKKIMRKDTMTVENSLGKVWCSKHNNDVDFFTMDGINPENGKELKLASDHMILKYAGLEIDSLQTVE